MTDPTATPTANYHWLKPMVGGSTTTWGQTLNDDLDAIDAQVFAAANPAGLTVSSTPGTAVKGTLSFLNSAAPTSQKTRWVWAEDTTTETGGNVGSNLALNAYSDAGVAISAPLSFVRSTGAATFGGALTIVGPLTASGVTNGSDASAGQIGEVISSNVVSPGVTLSNGVVVNVTSISLTAGDWDVQGEVWVTTGTGGATVVIAGISVVSASFSGVGIAGSRNSLATSFTANSGNVFPLRPCRVSLSGTTNYYLTTLVNFPSGTTTAYGNIWARRAR